MPAFRQQKLSLMYAQLLFAFRIQFLITHFWKEEDYFCKCPALTREVCLTKDTSESKRENIGSGALPNSFSFLKWLFLIVVTFQQRKSWPLKMDFHQQNVQNRFPGLPSLMLEVLPLLFNLSGTETGYKKGNVLLEIVRN